MASQPNLPAVVDKNDEFTAALMAAGFITPSMGGSTINRIKVVGSTLMLGDDVIAAYNPKTKEPMLIVQIMESPVQYQGMWFDKDGKLANAVGRPTIAGKFCKSHFETPGQERKFSEDGTSCEQCPVHPFMPFDHLPEEAIAQDGASRCAWRGEIEFRILDKQEDGTYIGNDETVYTLSLPTTAMIEFVGSNSRNSNQQAGSVSPESTVVRLAKLGIQKWGDGGILKAKTALALGGVICELRVLPATNKEKNYNYNVVSFNPIEILEVTEALALPGTSNDADNDPVPF